LAREHETGDCGVEQQSAVVTHASPFMASVHEELPLPQPLADNMSPKAIAYNVVRMIPLPVVVPIGEA